MSYQEIYKGITKKASAEQVKELAGMIKQAWFMKEAAGFRLTASTPAAVRKFVQEWVGIHGRMPSKKIVNRFLAEQAAKVTQKASQAASPAAGAGSQYLPVPFGSNRQTEKLWRAVSENRQLSPKEIVKRFLDAQASKATQSAAGTGSQYLPIPFGANRRAKKLWDAASETIKDMAKSNQRQAAADAGRIAGRNETSREWRNRVLKWGIPAGLTLTAGGATAGTLAGRASMQGPLNTALAANKKLTEQNQTLRNQSGWAKIWEEIKKWLASLLGSNQNKPKVNTQGAK